MAYKWNNKECCWEGEWSTGLNVSQGGWSAEPNVLDAFKKSVNIDEQRRIARSDAHVPSYTIPSYTKEHIKEILGYTKEEYINMLQTKANGGIMMDDHLDGLRSRALADTSVDGLPNSVVSYIKALELSYLNTRHYEKLKTVDEVTFKVNAAIF